MQATPIIFNNIYKTELLELMFKLGDEINYVYDRGFTINSVNKLIETDFLEVFLLKSEDRKIVGCLAFYITPDLWNGDITADEAFFYVLPEYRGQGNKLLKFAEKKLLAKIPFLCKIRFGIAFSLEKYMQRQGYKSTKLLVEKDLCATGEN